MKKMITLLILLICTSSAQAADYFLKIEGIDGESKSKGHDKWIDVISIDWGMSKPGRVLIGLTKNGKRVSIKKDGKYHTRDGKMIVIVNGRIAKIMPSRLSRHQSVVPGAAKGGNRQSEPSGKRSGDMIMKGKKILQN